MDLPEAAAYALHQIDVAARALAVAGQRGGPAGLTAREAQVLRLIADGATTRAISERLFISAKTADNHIQHIYTKLGVTNRAAATRWALDHGLVEPATADDPGPEMGTRNEEISSCARTPGDGTGFPRSSRQGRKTPGSVRTRARRRRRR